MANYVYGGSTSPQAREAFVRAVEMYPEYHAAPGASQFANISSGYGMPAEVRRVVEQGREIKRAEYADITAGKLKPEDSWFYRPEKEQKEGGGSGLVALVVGLILGAWLF